MQVQALAAVVRLSNCSPSLSLRSWSWRLSSIMLAPWTWLSSWYCGRTTLFFALVGRFPALRTRSSALKAAFRLKILSPIRTSELMPWTVLGLASCVANTFPVEDELECGRMGSFRMLVAFRGRSCPTAGAAIQGPISDFGRIVTSSCVSANGPKGTSGPNCPKFGLLLTELASSL